MVAESFSQKHQKCDENEKLSKSIIVCADDFGQAADISKGIFELLELKRINATSCLTNFTDFQTDALLLKSLDHIFVGLHLNLTEGSPLTKAHSLSNNGQFNSLNKLLLRSQLRLLNLNSIYLELKAQLERFIHTFNQMPHFLDGHQHIHHLPIVREAVLRLYDEYHLKKTNTFIRNVAYIVDQRNLKSFIIQYSGAKRLQKLLKQKNIPHNLSFGGIYNFHPNTFSEAFSYALKHITDNGLIMCHPGYKVDFDVLSQSRETELKYFKSDDYLNTLKDYHISLKQP
ncbi:ChbG/HpnK family deacetylase [Thiotrichales bacterium 19X7-9]|nr:ChbG/HpnK family deacetylase [Thiotrichales bacterium 19X7-9]